MVSPVRVICVVVWGIGWWLVLAHSISPQYWLVQPSYPSLKEELGNALLGDQWINK